jgi:antitoxin MazE
METKIQKWGNSLGLRIPKSFAVDARFEEGSTVNLAIEGGDLIVRAVRRKRYELTELLRGVNAKNIHEAVESGPPVGREAW